MICRKIPFLNLFIYIQILFCLLAITFAAHPMLYFNSNDIARLRHKAKTTHAKIAKIIEETGRSLKDEPKQYLPPESFEEFGSRWNELYGNNLCAFAMYCVLYPDDMRALRLVCKFVNVIPTLFIATKIGGNVVSKLFLPWKCGVILY